MTRATLLQQKAWILHWLDDRAVGLLPTKGSLLVALASIEAALAALPPNEALTEVCKLLLDEYELTPEQIANLALNIPQECEGILENRAQDAWDAHQESLMESGGPDDSAYRRDMINAGRGHLLR